MTSFQQKDPVQNHTFHLVSCLFCLPQARTGSQSSFDFHDLVTFEDYKSDIWQNVPQFDLFDDEFLMIRFRLHIFGDYCGNIAVFLYLVEHNLILSHIDVNFNHPNKVVSARLSAVKFLFY